MSKGTDFHPSQDEGGTVQCHFVQAFGSHGEVVVYCRPWRRWFRKTYVLRCWTCDIEIMEPR